MKRFALTLFLAACVSGPPPNWSRARIWTFPLCAPQSGTAAVLGTIDGHGPYVWFIDTGSAYTTIDPRVAAELHLHAVASGRWRDLADQKRRWLGQVSQGQIKQWRVGDLTVSEPQFVIAQVDTATYAGHPVAGWLGLDTIRYMTLEVDYDAGVARLGLPGELPLPSSPAPARAWRSQDQLYVSTALGAFKLRSGSGVSTVFAEKARELALPKAGAPGLLPTFGGAVASDVYVVPAIEVGGSRVDRPRLIAQPIAPENDAVGSFGGDVLRAFHWFVDVDGGRVVLAPRTRTEPKAPEPPAVVIHREPPPPPPPSCPDGKEGRIEGTVRDATGAPLPRANLLLTGRDLEVPELTDDDGHYAYPCLAGGRYEMLIFQQDKKRPPVRRHVFVHAPGLSIEDAILR